MEPQAAASARRQLRIEANARAENEHFSAARQRRAPELPIATPPRDEDALEHA
jgi:hypothetical protein